MGVDLKHIGHRIHQERRTLGLSQADVGERIGRHQSIVSDIERGELLSLDVGILGQIADALQVRLGYLLGLDEVVVHEQAAEGSLLWNLLERMPAYRLRDMELIAHAFLAAERQTSATDRKIVQLLEIIRREGGEAAHAEALALVKGGGAGNARGQLA